MSIIYFTVCILFFLLNISARPSPQVIYSATIYNRQDSTISCNVLWLQPSNEILESETFHIQENGNFTVNETIVNMGTWDARLIIDGIQCNGLKLKAPFRGVTAPSVNWIFVVQPNKIRSIKPKPSST